MTDPIKVEVDGLSLDELLPWLEFGCWTALVLAPILYYVNGPRVSNDQAVVRTGLVIVAAVGAVTLRLVNWRRRRAVEEKNHELQCLYDGLPRPSSFSRRPWKAIVQLHQHSLPHHDRR